MECFEWDFDLTFKIKALDDEYPHTEYNRQAKSDCQKTGVYCVASVALLILAGAMGNPTFVASIPGGVATSTLVSFGIIIGVLILCYWQRPRKSSPATV